MPTKLALDAGYRSPMPDDLEAAWAAVHDATPTGWYVGQPSYHDDRHQWAMYAFDPSERPSVGTRSRDWTAIEREGSTRRPEMAEPHLQPVPVSGSA